MQYNPLYFASAACLLAGVFLLGRDLPSDAFGSKLGIAAVAETYQLVLALGAWLLLRAGQRRAAVLLGLVAFFLLLDVAFNSERLFSHAGLMDLGPGMRLRRALSASAILAVLGPVKLLVLARVFRIRRGGPVLAVGSMVLAAIPLLPYAVDAAPTFGEHRQAAQLVAAWLGAPLLGWACTRAARRWFTEWAWDEESLSMTRRIALAIPALMVAGFAVHAAALGTLPELRISGTHFAPYVLVSALVLAARMARRHPAAAEAVAWIGSAIALTLAALPPAPLELGPLTAMALAISGGLFVLAWREGLRLLLPAVTLGLAGAWLLTEKSAAPLPVPGPIWAAAAAVLLVAAALLHRDFRCLFASTLAAGAACVLIDRSLVPFGLVAASTWLAAWSWTVFPELRRWIPLAATIAALAGGTFLLWSGVPSIGPWYAAAAILSLLAGRAFSRSDFQFAGAAALANLAACTRGSWLPGGAGGLLVAGAFALLAAGLAFNLREARRRREDPEPIPVGSPLPYARQ